MRSKFAFAALLGMGYALALPAPAALAYTAFVTNEKDNSVSVIDTEKLEVIKTFPVGQRPRGVILSNDGKWLSSAPATTAIRNGHPPLLRRHSADASSTVA